ncbi:VCBS repeat-containing protein [Undibacterium flavidum]|uniref:VCBS repeat-containing protein n=1 Tax=Undibacterium flavidum TaxID=2762297 RepID=A0ABR6YEX6_9BURK|nr:VCBS repeat-containing protein [Undibacterium flavidum]MBC3875110.1 VCBS repeat-containing protein [Undibacterium flavidum]
MKIASSDIQLQASYVATQKLETQEKTRAWVGNQRPDFEGMEARLRDAGKALGQTQNVDKSNMSREARSLLPFDLVQLSDAALQAQAQARSNDAVAATDAASAVDHIQDDVDNDPRMMVIRYLIELLTGRKIDTLKTSDLQDNSVGNACASQPAAAQNAAEAAQKNPRPNAGWGVEIDVHHSYTETEKTQFQATGSITTADNKQIKFNLSFELNRSYHEENQTQIRKGDGKKVDPLTLNFSGNSAQLTSQKFEFDLNADGKKDSISFVKGAGFLAFDKNNDGKINDGTELFGPGTGNGFSELAAYDSDGNHWIDENDAIYSKLKVWTKDAAGKDQLQSLKQANVGALFLGQVETPFELKSGNNHSDGQIRSTGLWLTEDGQAKTMQQVDLVV